MDTTTEKHEHLLSFVRIGKGSVDAMINLLVASHHERGRDALTALSKAVSDWVEETENGSSAYENSSQELNIGDLVNEDAFENAELLSRLERHGVTFLKVFHGEVVDYDRHIHVL